VSPCRWARDVLPQESVSCQASREMFVRGGVIAAGCRGLRVLALRQVSRHWKNDD